MTFEERGGVVSGTLRKAVPVVLPIVAFSLVMNLLRLTVPMYMLQVIDRVLTSESSETLISLTVLAIGAVLVSGMLTSATSFVNAGVGAWVDEELYPRLIARTVQARAKISPKAGTGPLRELAQLRQFFASPTLITLLEIPWTFVFLGVLVYLHPGLAIVGALAMVVLLMIAALDEIFVQSKKRSAMRRKESATQALEDAVPGLDAVKAMGFQHRLSRVLSRSNRESSRELDRATRRGAAIQSLSRAVRTSAQIGILGTGAALVLEGEITTGTMVGGSILLSLALSPVDKAIGTIASVKSFLGVVHRLDRQLSREEAPPATDISKAGPGGFALSAKQAAFIPEGARHPVLRPVSFEIEPGESLGIIGPVGAGKTTLSRLIAGVSQPSSGAVLLNEVAVARISSPLIRDRIGYLPQHGTLLPGTLAENISRFAEGEPEEIASAVSAAAKLAGVHNKILSLKDGYDTRLSFDTHEHLSRGQLQQVLIARAFYGEPKLLILDEPSAYLDKAGNEALARALRQARDGGTTIVLVSQKPGLIALCDRLLHLRDGIVVDLGPRPEVLERVASGDIRPMPRGVPNRPGERETGERK